MYESLASFAQTWGLLFFFAVFIGVLVYALWPKNREKFDAAARMPLNDDSPTGADGKEDDRDD
ncbi:cbb3-type cytochrome c oxidase subunit 3 [Hyphobacterium sp.]|uniref:cbb3-type cytochrome c oxidase subunit 3 n=1 Tax=Hyphobacterium sp. TaxID=2004662 RepID=UPI003B522018